MWSNEVSIVAQSFLNWLNNLKIVCERKYTQEKYEKLIQKDFPYGISEYIISSHDQIGISERKNGTDIPKKILK